MNTVTFEKFINKEEEAIGKKKLSNLVKRALKSFNRNKGTLTDDARVCIWLNYNLRETKVDWAWCQGDVGRWSTSTNVKGYNSVCLWSHGIEEDLSTKHNEVTKHLYQ